MDPRIWMRQVRDKEFFFAFFDVLFLVLSGILPIFFFERPFFLSTDWVKLVFLSAGVTAPFVFLNTIAIASFEDDDRVRKKDGLFLAMTMASMSTTVFLNGPLVAVYWQGATLKVYMVVVAILEIMLFASATIKQKQNERRSH